MQPLSTPSALDVSQFPFVLVRNEAIVSGYALRWIENMRTLLRIGMPFVMIFPPDRPEEPHEDRKQRGIWLKQNRDLLAALCRALVTVETDEDERAAALAAAPGVAKAFGVPVEVVASLEEARHAARRRMAETV